MIYSKRNLELIGFKIKRMSERVHQYDQYGDVTCIKIKLYYFPGTGPDFASCP